MGETEFSLARRKLQFRHEPIQVSADLIDKIWRKARPGGFGPTHRLLPPFRDFHCLPRQLFLPRRITGAVAAMGPPMTMVFPCVYQALDAVCFSIDNIKCATLRLRLFSAVVKNARFRTFDISFVGI
jgi:hypothetical protein